KISIGRRPCEGDRWSRLAPAAFQISSWRLLASPSRDGAAGRFERRKGCNRCVIRVFIVAASPLIRAGLQSMLADSRVDVVGSAPDLEPISAQLVDIEPDVVLVEAAADAHQELLDMLRIQKLRASIPSSCYRSRLKLPGFPTLFAPACGPFCRVKSHRNNSEPLSKPRQPDC